MPLYRCKSPAGSVWPERRSRIASEFTRIHSELTGAPPSFVHVHFVDIDRTRISEVEPYEIHGTIRAVRSKDVTTQLADQLTAAFCNIAEVEPADVTMRLTEVPASWIMEGGEISPEPGAEAQWMERHSHPPHS